MLVRPGGPVRRPLLLLLALCMATPAPALASLTAPSATATPPVLAPSASATATVSNPGSLRSEVRAERALIRVRTIFDARAGVRQRSAPSRPGATLALRRLVLLRGSLRGADRAEADRLLARPTDGPLDPGGTGYSLGTSAKATCTSVICVHWVNTSGDRVSQTDSNHNNIPDYVDRVAATVSRVHRTYVAAGYRAAKPDGSLGGNSKPDIYLADIGPNGLYGYCTTDQNVPAAGPYDTWAYCVLDNDYARNEFPTNTPIENLQVTAAHEYFHAVQFAYDIAEDGWFMEATATWAEDELYDNVNDNRQYLVESPLRQPQSSMDEFGGFRQYGDWIFFRYLTEQFHRSRAGLPTLILDIWRRADGARGGADQYSLQAIANTLRSRGKILANVFAGFADANRRPAASYSEGRNYPTAPLAARVTLSTGHRAATLGDLRLDHLTSRTVRFAPSDTLSNSHWKLRLTIDLAPAGRGSAAIARVYRRSGGSFTVPIHLDKHGDARKVLPFAAGKVRHVELTLVNASGRFSCWQGTDFSCQGVSKDDDKAGRVSGAAVK